MKVDRKQDLNVLYQVCVFWADLKTNMDAPVSDWLRHFQLLLWNRWTEFKETAQESRSRSQHPLPCFFFLEGGRGDWLEKSDGCPSLWWLRHFCILKPLKWIHRNFTGIKISASSTKFVFFGPIGKTRWLSRSVIGGDIFYFSFETA